MRIRIGELICCILLPAIHGIGEMAGDHLPNVVFILADDVGWCDVGAYHRHVTGTTNAVPTPNLDRLVSEGMMFTDAQLPAALCAPTRFSLITGSNPCRSRPDGTWNRTATSAFDFGEAENDRAQNPHRTIGEVMQTAGYQTSFFGKMHFGGDFFNAAGNVVRDANTPAELNDIDYTRTFENALCDHGFHYTFVTPDGIQGPMYAYFENDKWTKISDIAGDIDGVDVAAESTLRTWLTSDTLGLGRFEMDGYGDSEFDTSEHGSILTHKARAFIDQHLTRHHDTPFFLYYAAPAIHLPLTPSGAGYIADGATGVGKRGDFLYDLDYQVGLILDKLDTAGIADNTIVIFTSDNGGSFKESDGMVVAGQRPDGPLRGKKGSIYEGGHRVPFIWKWGDGTASGSVIPPGSVCSQMVSVIDWVASMIDLTGQMVANDQHYDSETILPLLFADDPNTVDPPHAYLYQKDNNGYFGVHIRDRDGRWFYKRRNGAEAQELYNLDTDLGQATNLVAGYAQPGDLPAAHPQYQRVTDANSWFLAHNDYADARTVPARDYRFTNSVPDWVKHGGFESPSPTIGPPNNTEAWNEWKLTGEQNTFSVQVREITPPDDGNLLSDPSDSGLTGAHSDENALLFQYYYDGATVYQDLGGFTFDNSLTYVLTAWVAPYKAHASNTDDTLSIRVRALTGTSRPVVASTVLNLDSLPEDTWTQVTLTVWKYQIAAYHKATPRIEFHVADGNKWRVAIDDVSFAPSEPQPASIQKTRIPINVPSPLLGIRTTNNAPHLSWQLLRSGVPYAVQRNADLRDSHLWSTSHTFTATNDRGSWPDPRGMALTNAFYRVKAPRRVYRYDLSQP